MSTLLPLAVPPPKLSRHFPWSPLIGPDLAALIVQLNDTDFFAPASSVALTVTPDVPAVVGVPLTVPVVALMVRPAGSPVWLQVSGLPAVELPAIGRLTWAPTLFVWVPGLVILIESLTAPVATQPPAALLHRSSMAKGVVEVDSVRLNAPPGLPGGIPAHLSPTSANVPGSNQPVPNGSVSVPAYRAPPMILKPSLFPPGAGLTKSSAQFAPASCRYGRFMYGAREAPW